MPSSASPAPGWAPGTIGQELPPGFQRSEFLYRHGFVDRVVQRADLRRELAQVLRYRGAGARGGRAWLTGSGRAPGAGPGSRAGRDDGRAGGREGDRVGPRPAGPQPPPPAHPRAARRDRRRVRRAPRRPAVRRRRGGRGRLRHDRRPPGRGRGPAEGRRHRGERPAQLRHAPPGGLPQGDAGDGARGALGPAGRDVRRRARGAPWPRVRGAGHRRGDRPVGRA